jgi:cytochrome P450
MFWSTDDFIFFSQPGLPHSWFFGHLPVIAKEAAKLPRDAHAYYLMDRLMERYNLRSQDCLVLDTYPLTSYSTLVIYGMDMSRQVTQMPRQFVKHQVLRDLHRIVGKKGMLLLEGQAHKEIRAIFNPGFSHRNVISMSETIVEEVEVFASKMAAMSNSDGFVSSFHEHSMSLTLDIIGRIVLGQQMNSQLQSHELADIVKELESLLRSNLSNFSLSHLDPWRISRTLVAERKAKRYFDNLIRERWQHLVSQSQSMHGNSSLDVALRTYRAKLSPDKQSAPLPSHFVDTLSDRYGGVRAYILNAELT